MSPTPRARYSGYKRARLPWLDEVPAHWDEKRLRFAVTVGPSRKKLDQLPQETVVSFVPMEAIGEYGSIDLGQERELGDIGSSYTYFADGDVVIAKITPCFENGKGAIACGLANGVALGTTELHVLRPGAELDSRFLYYLTASNLFRTAGEAMMYGAGGQKRVPEEFIKDFIAAIPPLAEQSAIAAFLDRETARIDALVDKKCRLIDLLKAQHRALIARAVTKGLDADAKLIDSGVPWLGKIPASWQIVPLKRAVTFQRGHDLPSDQREDGEVPVVTSAGISSTHNAARAKGPGIVTGRYGTIGAFTLVPTDYWPLNTTLYSIDMHGNCVRFLWYMLHNLSELFVLNAQKSAVPGIDRNDLHPVLTAVPPSHEQEKIAAYLDRRVAQVGNVVAKTEFTIDRLVEVRQAMISDAVTGKVDVSA